VYDRIGQKATFVIHVNIEPHMVYALSPKLQTALLAESALKARVLLIVSRPQKLQNG